MRGFVVAWVDRDGVNPDRIERLAATARVHGFRDARVTQVQWCGVTGPTPPHVRDIPGGILIGDLFGAHALPSGTDDLDTSRALIRTAWGRYVAIFQGEGGRTQAAFRDPSGAMECFHWRSGGLRLVASATPDWLMTTAPPEGGIDWNRVEQILLTPEQALKTTPLEELVALAPGEFIDLTTDARTCLFRPDDIAGQRFGSPVESVRRLRDGLDDVLSSLARGVDRLGAEISGGLDSAIVVGALAAAGRRLDFGLNTFAPQSETDERLYAEAVAERIGVTLTRRQRPILPLTAEILEDTAGDPRPSQNGRDVFNDMVVSRACAEAGVQTLLTGKGGDALFFQGHTPLAFADLWQERGWPALTSPLLPGVARWTRTSTWSVLRAARRVERSDRDARRLAPEMPPPAKRRQIEQIRSGLAYYGGCRRADVVDMVHPLMTQPMIEWALRTPVADLVAAGEDRALARAAFADLLPEVVRHRRSKGDYSVYFHRQIATNLPFLRTYLLDGRLASQGLIDRSDYEARLHPDSLRWRGGAAEILAAASLEAWVRRWERRLA